MFQAWDRLFMQLMYILATVEPGDHGMERNKSVELTQERDKKRNKML